MMRLLINCNITLSEYNKGSTSAVMLFTGLWKRPCSVTVSESESLSSLWTTSGNSANTFLQRSRLLASYDSSYILNLPK